MNKSEAFFLLMYERLKDFVHKNKRRPQKSDDAQLYDFYNRMKAMYKKGRLSPERYEMLFPYVEFRDELELHWEEMYSKAAIFYKENGNLKVPEQTELAKWIYAQRQMYNRAPDKYRGDRKKKLDDIGMSWNLYDANFEEKIALADNAIALYGRVPTKEEDPIRIWIDDVKSDYKKNQIPENRMSEITRVLGDFLDIKKRQTGRDVYLLQKGEIKECHSSIESIVNKYSEASLGVSRYLLYKHDFSIPYINKYIKLEYFVVQTITKENRTNDIPTTISKSHPLLPKIISLYNNGMRLIDICDKYHLQWRNVWNILKDISEVNHKKNIRLSESEKEEIVQMRIDGLSLNDIIDKFDISKTTVQRILQKHGITGLLNNPLRIRTEEEINAIISSYQNGDSENDIVVKYNLKSPYWIHKILKENGIDKRERIRRKNKNISHSKQRLNFYRKNPVRLTSSDKEKIIKMRLEGITLRDIAEKFDITVSTVCRYIRMAKKERMS